MIKISQNNHSSFSNDLHSVFIRVLHRVQTFWGNNVVNFYNTVIKARFRKMMKLLAQHSWNEMQISQSSVSQISLIQHTSIYYHLSFFSKKKKIIK